MLGAGDGDAGELDQHDLQGHDPAVEGLRRQDHAAKGEAACIEFGLEGVDDREQPVEARVLARVLGENAFGFGGVDGVFASHLKAADREAHDGDLFGPRRKRDDPDQKDP